MPVTVILPRSLVSLIPGTRHATEVDAATVREAIDRLDELTPGLRNRLVDAGPVLRRHINVYVDREPATLDTPLPPGATVHVIPAVSGG
ncbi:MAG TPA: MoaD/ThiS family protein [Candidatus Limnocylindrales bacterium]|nr:MoaD/ThiS family protein [Candidatus Limnocylindrales bacterium]